MSTKVRRWREGHASMPQRTLFRLTSTLRNADGTWSEFDRFVEDVVPKDGVTNWLVRPDEVETIDDGISENAMRISA